jgi:signal recognition particle subunit SRP54
MFDNLSAKLDRAFKNIKGQGRITELNVAATVKEIRRALIDADVNYKIFHQIKGAGPGCYDFCFSRATID